MLRWITAGESHGPALVAVLEGMVAGVEITTKELAAELARRRLGYGRGARMKFEADELEVIGGVRHGLTQGGPVAIRIGNSEWPKWETVMAADPVDPELIAGRARNAPLTRPRPGHADLAGMTKFGFDDARPVLERASARETAARVALGTVAQAFLKQALDVDVVSHVVALGAVEAPDGDGPGPTERDRVDASPVRAYSDEVTAAMVAEVDAAQVDGDTLGGVVEVIAYGLPVGLGSYVQSDRRLDARLAGALMGIQAMKGVEIGDGFRTARRRGSAAHDEMLPGDPVKRLTNRAGGIEGGMTNGEPVRVRVAMKPISTVPRALRTVDVATGEAAAGHPPALGRLRRARGGRGGRGDGGAGAGRRGAGEVRRRLLGGDAPQRAVLPRRAGLTRPRTPRRAGGVSPPGARCGCGRGWRPRGSRRRLSAVVVRLRGRGCRVVVGPERGERRAGARAAGQCAAAARCGPGPTGGGAGWPHRTAVVGPAGGGVRSRCRAAAPTGPPSARCPGPPHPSVRGGGAAGRHRLLSAIAAHRIRSPECALRGLRPTTAQRPLPSWR